MADSTLAQDGTLNAPAPKNRRADNRVLRKMGGAWRVSRCWARFMSAGGSPLLPQLVDFAVRNHIFTAMQSPVELMALGERLGSLRPECALEIGTARGGTLLFLTRLARPHATIVSVDLPDGEFGGGYGAWRGWFYQRFARAGQTLHLLRGNSHSAEMLDRVKVCVGDRALDYLFIDGDHTYEGVKSDYEIYGPMVRRGGMIAFHDIVDAPAENAGGVPEFWREVRSKNRSEEIIARPAGGWGIGVLYVE